MRSQKILAIELVEEVGKDAAVDRPFENNSRNRGSILTVQDQSFWAMSAGSGEVCFAGCLFEAKGELTPYGWLDGSGVGLIDILQTRHRPIGF